MAKRRRRPSNVPKLGEWRAAAKYWAWTDPRTRIGHWWNDRGVVICEWTQGTQGRPHGEMRHYHHNGELACKQTQVHGVINGTQICYAPIKRGKPSSFWPRAHPLIRRIERTWNRGRPSNETFFDAQGRVVDHLHRRGNARAVVTRIGSANLRPRGATQELRVFTVRRRAL
jgi:hypothetical protein